MSLLMTGNSDGQRCAPAGVSGGQNARLAEMEIISPDGKRRPLRTFVTVPIFPGEACESRNSGGGGWGNPLNRNPQRVVDDVRAGFISTQRARDVYGVEVDAVSWTFDAGATAKLRARLRDTASSN